MRSNHRTKPEKKAEASSANSIITTQADWDAGTFSNVINNDGSIDIQNKATSRQQVLISNYTTSASPENGKDNPVSSSSWQSTIADDTYVAHSSYWSIDLQETMTISAEFTFHRAPVDYVYYYYSVDGVTWTSTSTTMSCVNPNEYDEYMPESCFSVAYSGGIETTPLVVARYIKFTIPGTYVGTYPQYFNLFNFEIFEDRASGTHTTGATQIDGGANFWQWETFTDSKSTPANTSVTYRYRTSANGTDWTAWVGTIGSVTSRTGDDSNNPTKYRYLQIEATLSNTDGTSTPTIDSYSIGYHTNQKPNAPTAMTAVVN